MVLPLSELCRHRIIECLQGSPEQRQALVASPKSAAYLTIVASRDGTQQERQELMTACIGSQTLDLSQWSYLPFDEIQCRGQSIMENLTTIRCRDMKQITAVVFRTLSKMAPHLQHIDARGCAIESLYDCSLLQLRLVNLSGNPCCAELGFLQRLSHIAPQLQKCTISFCEGVSFVGGQFPFIEHVRSNFFGCQFPYLESIEIDNCSDAPITPMNEDVVQLSFAAPQLKQITFLCNTQITSFAGCSFNNLQAVHLKGRKNALTDEGVATLKQQAPQLKSFSQLQRI